METNYWYIILVVEIIKKIIKYNFKIFIFIFSIMPVKLNMVISNGNAHAHARLNAYNGSTNYNQPNPNLASISTAPVVKTSSALNAPIISRIHGIRPGCGSCGRR
jgi:hypothetical protein